MKRTEINQAFAAASRCFFEHGWSLPPNAKWDITDFGLGNFPSSGLTLINLASEPEYCEKLMYAARSQRTPCHMHAKKKEDIVCRTGKLELWLWPQKPSIERILTGDTLHVSVNGVRTKILAGSPVVLEAGSRITLAPGIWHAFAPQSEHCIIGEVSTGNDDRHDNFFLDENVDRFPGIIEDEPARIHLVSE